MKYSEPCTQPFRSFERDFSNSCAQCPDAGTAQQRSCFLTTLEQALVFGLLEEVRTTPKPGLVDLADNGAHQDMSYATFVRSTEAIVPYLTAMGAVGYDFTEDPQTLFPKLRPLGKQAEAAMFSATGSVNTHKGAIFTLGLLSAGIGYLFRHKGCFAAAEIFALCSAMAAPWLKQDFEEMHRRPPATHGEKLFAQYGFRGIRGEVLDAFPALRCVALPALVQGRRTQPNANSTSLFVLLTLMATVEDTNILTRAGPAALHQVQREAQHFLADFPVLEEQALQELSRMNLRFIAQNISPGGCADLLAATLFFGQLDASGILQL